MALAVKSCPPPFRVGLGSRPPPDHVENSLSRRKTQPETPLLSERRGGAGGSETSSQGDSSCPAMLHLLDMGLGGRGGVLWSPTGRQKRPENSALPSVEYRLIPRHLFRNSASPWG